MSEKILMGIDGGGTYTRVLITDLEGNLLSHVKYEGGASFHKNANAIVNVQTAILTALKKCHRHLEDIQSIVSGIAGYDSENDLSWVNELTSIEGIKANKVNYNDGVIAHAGALLGHSGIITIAGTGSIVLGLNEKNQYIRNYDFKHNAYGASRLLSYNFTHRVLARQIDQSDKTVVQQLLHHFQVSSIDELSEIGSQGFIADTQQRDKQFGDFTKHITEGAMKHSQLCQLICKETAFNIATGMQLVASTFETKTIDYALIGSIANSVYIKNHIQYYLNQSKTKSFQLVEKPLCPEIGAIILGMKNTGIEITDQMIANLYKTNENIQ